MGKVKFYRKSSLKAALEKSQSDHDAIVFGKSSDTEQKQVFLDGEVYAEPNNFTSIKVGSNDPQTSGDVIINADTLGLQKVYNPMGSIDTYQDLVFVPYDKRHAGDVYDVKENGMNYAWVMNGTMSVYEFELMSSKKTVVDLFIYEQSSTEQIDQFKSYIKTGTPITKANVYSGSGYETNKGEYLVYIMKYNSNNYMIGYNGTELIGLKVASQGSSMLLTPCSVGDTASKVTLTTVATADAYKWDELGAKYQNASSTAAGLMSKEDKAKLDGIEAGANKYVLPNASTSTKGGVKVGDGISVSSGTISAKVQAYGSDNNEEILMVGTIADKGTTTTLHRSTYKASDIGTCLDALEWQS